MRDFNLPDGASFIGRDGDRYQFSVSLPSDEQGFLGRQCPECRRIFRIDDGDYSALPDDIELWCTYCGHNAPHQEFVTDQQYERAVGAATDVGRQIVANHLDQMFSRLKARPRRNRLVSVHYSRSSLGPPVPLRAITEEPPVRHRRCQSCDVTYAIFGEHRFCPTCGPLSPQAVARDSLEAEVARLHAFDGLNKGDSDILREAGVLDRVYVDTLENLVGVVEVLARAIFSDGVAGAEALLRGKGAVFQRLPDLARLFGTHFNCDIAASLGADWPALQEVWAIRHVYVHNDGRVDERFKKAVPTSQLAIGQRVPVTAAIAEAAVERTRRLCSMLTECQP